MHPQHVRNLPKVVVVQAVSAALILLGTVGDVWLAGLAYRIPLFFLGGLAALVVSIDHFTGALRLAIRRKPATKLRRVSRGPAPAAFLNACIGLAMFWLLLYRWYFSFFFLGAYQIGCLEIRALYGDELARRKQERARLAMEQAFGRSMECQRRLLSRDPGHVGGADDRP
jgi:hypothetical protein